MYLLLLLGSYFISVTGESCKTPSGQLGECRLIRFCSTLLWSFTNIKIELVDYLNKFVCSNGELGLMVCCSVANDYLTFENGEDVNREDVTRLKQLINVNECGITTNPVADNGIIRLQDFPWLVKIMSVDNFGKKDEYHKVGCTGVLINKWYVLYSAQCSSTVLSSDPLLFVRIESYINKDESCTEASYSPKCSTYTDYSIAHGPHPYYDDQTKFNDIAILRLDNPVHFSDYIRPICLPILSESVKTGQTLQTAGWNRTYYADQSSVKRIQSSTAISNSDCKTRLQNDDNDFAISSYEMCTETEENVFGTDVTGFPLMSMRGNKWYLEGFESQGIINTKVYTRVQNYLHWIQMSMGLGRCLTPFNEIGEVTELNDCPKLFDAFANGPPNVTENLREFIFEFPDDDRSSNAYSMKVCCGVTPNFTISFNTIDKNVDTNIIDFKDCGSQLTDNYSLFNGNISFKEFPWMAVIMHTGLPKHRQLLCGGTLITDTYVLTSGRCSTAFNSYNSTLVSLGNHNLKDTISCIQISQSIFKHCSHIQEYKIEKKIIHPFYDRHTYINDISLLRLNKKVTFTDYIRPICLPKSKNYQGDYGQTLFFSGFGDRRRYVVGPKTKKKIPTTLITNEECKQLFRLSHGINPITTYHICTQDFINRTDAICLGDEGSSVMVMKESKWFIAGISVRHGCEDNLPQLYTNVYKYLTWIKLNIES